VTEARQVRFSPPPRSLYSHPRAIPTSIKIAAFTFCGRLGQAATSRVTSGSEVAKPAETAPDSAPLFRATPDFPAISRGWSSPTRGTRSLRTSSHAPAPASIKSFDSSPSAAFCDSMRIGAAGWLGTPAIPRNYCSTSASTARRIGSGNVGHASIALVSIGSTKAAPDFALRGTSALTQVSS
jgi:hypothetical protein